MAPTTVARPIAKATIQPTGNRTTIPRDHLIRVVIKLSAVDAKYADKGYVASVARKSLEGFPPADGRPDQRRFSDVSVSSKAGAGSASSVVVGVEGSVVWPDRPGDDSVECLRAALLSEGYRVAVRGKRECAASACMSDAMVDWDQPSNVPSGWYSNLICGRHNYRTCSNCKGICVPTSANSAGQEPSVQCEVCGVVM